MKTGSVATCRTAVLLLALAAGLLWAAAARAEARVAVVDSQKLVLESAVGKAARAKVAALRTKLQAAVEVKRREFESARKEHMDRALAMPPAQRDESQRRLEKMQTDLDRAVEDAQATIRREGKRIEEEIQKKVVGFLEQYGKENGYTVILDRLQCLFNAPEAEITPQVLAAFDRANPAP
jgi:outer membrane protein